MANNPISFSVRSDVQSDDLNVNGNLQVIGNNISSANPNNHLRAGQGYNVAVGYAPNLSAANGGTATTSWQLLRQLQPAVLNLNLFPGLGLDTATTAANALSTTLILPSGSQVVRAIVNNHGTSINVGDQNYNIGYTTTGLSASDFIFDAVTPASINGTGAAVMLSATTPDATWTLRNVGTALDTVLTGDSFVTVTNVGSGDSNSTGDLKIIIEYIIV